ncbi:MAG TPA: cytochrome-c peroxidase [Polyangiaceae bacterium]|nr:cytochrome-c peroxidase [Polyangiaceae bacterium]
MTPISVIVADSTLDPTRVELGEVLFRDKRLSANGRVACATCHDLSHAGTDGSPRSTGVANQPLSVNTPTVFNAALNFRQFWDGRALTLEDQLDGPLLSPLEMGSTWPQILERLRVDHEISSRFMRSYPEGPTQATVKDALATFERSLNTPDSPFDRYLAGDTNALSPIAARGYQLFTSYGCSACHQGRGVGGNMFQKLGTMGNYFDDRGGVTEADFGRFNVTHEEADRHVFKVPSLRNVARTAPYLHDGSVATLDQAVRVMARYQLGRDLAEDETTALVAFLDSLTGSYGGRRL